MNRLLAFLLTVFLVWIAASLVHELAHGLTAEALGGKFLWCAVWPGIEVWPHPGQAYEGEIALYKTVQGLLDRGVTQILLDMAGIDLMDSSGLGELVRAEKAARSKGTVLKLMQVAAGVGRTLSLAQLSGTFETFSSEADALASFRR